MNKAIGMALVIAAALAIFLFLKTSPSEEASSASRESHDTQQDDRGADSRGDDNGAAPQQGTPRPLRMSGSDSAVSGTPRTREYMRDDGTSVRDHRSVAVSENYERRVTMPVGISPVQPQTLVAVRSALRPAMNECIANNAAEVPSGASVQAVLTVSIQSELLTVDKLAVTTEGLAEDEELKACITSAILGHQQQVSGAKDVDAHTMTFPYDL